MTYEKLYKIYKEQFAITGLDMSQLGKLINLVGALYVGSKKKDPSLKLYSFIYDKILKVKVITSEDKFAWKKAEEGSMDNLILPLCLTLDYYFEECGFKPTTFGIKDSKEILKMINEIIDNRIPF